MSRIWQEYWGERLHGSVAEAKSMLTPKRREREKIEEDIQTFLAKGGEIQQYSSGEGVMLQKDGKLRVGFSVTGSCEANPEATLRSQKKGARKAWQESVANKRTRKEVRDQLKAVNWQRRNG